MPTYFRSNLLLVNRFAKLRATRLDVAQERTQRS